MDKPTYRESGYLWAVVFILLLSFFLRTTDIGANPLQGDEAWNAFLAYNEGHNGSRAELGVVSSSGVNQPPFFHDVFSIPFGFDPDPRIARLFMAAIQLLSMPVLYWFVRRYWSSRAALIALLLYAVTPRAVWAGRYLWNPYLALPFLIGLYTTGFLLSEGKNGKRWARWLHLPMLAFVILSHPIGICFGLLTFFFVVRDWLKTRISLRRFMIDYGISFALAVLVMMPWLVGYLHQRIGDPTDGDMTLRARSTPTTILAFVVDNPTSIDTGAFGVPLDAYVAPAWVDVIGWLTLIGGVSLLLYTIYRRNFANFAMGVAFLVMPAFSLVSPTRTFTQYMILMLPSGVIILAILLTSYKGNRRTVVALGTLTTAVLFVAQLAIILDAFQQVHSFNNFSRESMLSLNDMIKLRDEAVRPGKETIYLVDNGSTYAFTQALTWEILGDKGPSRVVWGDNVAFPVPAQGATYVGYADATQIPELYANQPSRLIDHNLYRVVDLPAGSALTPSCKPQGLSEMSSGAAILGYYTPSYSLPIPLVGQTWTIYILWKPMQQKATHNYQLFTHLVNASGDTLYAQNDTGGLVSSLWRDGDELVSKVTLDVKGKNPIGPLSVRVGMYTLPDNVNADVVDGEGSPVSQWVTIPVCAQF